MTGWEIYSGVIDIVKALAWPAVVAWVVWYLRDELKAAAKMLTEIGPTGAKFAPPQQVVETTAVVALGSEKASGTGVTASHNVQAFIGQVKSVISDDQLQPMLQKIRHDLSSMAGENQRDQIEALLYNSASLSVQLAHERTYNVIFGSQLTLLAQANGVNGLSQAAARGLFEQIAKPANPSLSFEQWIAYLTNSGLMQLDPLGNYVLTIYGRGFLKYIVDRKLSVFKLG
jgi:hypothetical protein